MGIGFFDQLESLTGIDLNGDGLVGGEGAQQKLRAYTAEDWKFPGLVKSRRRKLGQALGQAITARTFRTASAVSVHTDVDAAVHEAITNITATILQGMEEPDYVFIACTNNHSLSDAMTVVREIWSKPCLHGVTTCQGLAANSGVSGTQQHETFSMGLFAICDESPYSLYDVVGVQCTDTDIAGFPKRVEEETRGFWKHSLEGRRHENWKEMVGMWLSCTPTQEEPVQAAINTAMGEDTEFVPVCGGTAAPNSMAFPFVDSHVGYAASMSPPHVFEGGTPADGGMVLSVLHTSCRVKPIFNNFFTPVTWAHGCATVDAQGTLTHIGGRNATEVYREWLTRVEGRDPLPPNTEPDDFSNVPDVLIKTAQRPIAIRLSYTSEHSNDFITCPPLNLSRDGLKVVLDLQHFMKTAKDPDNIEVAGMLGVLCCTKMLDLKFSVMGAARLDEVNREIASSVRQSPFLVYFPLGEHGFIENRKTSAHGKLMSSFMLFCRDTGQDVEQMVSVLLAAEDTPAPEDPTKSDFRVPFTCLTRRQPAPASLSLSQSESVAAGVGDEEAVMSSYHYFSLQAKKGKAKQPVSAGRMPSTGPRGPVGEGLEQRPFRQAKEAERAVRSPQSGVAQEGSVHAGGSVHSFTSQHETLVVEDKMREHERARRRKRLCGAAIMAILSLAPESGELSKEMVEAFCDLLGAACLEELVLSSRCFLRLCFLIEHRLQELAADKRNVRTREWLELSARFGRIPWDVVEIGEKHFGLQLMEDLLANDARLWTDTVVTSSFQDFLTHPTCRTQVITMWDGPRVKSSSGYSARAVHMLHMASHVAYIACLVPSLFYSSLPLAASLAAYRMATVLDDRHFTRRRYNLAYTRIGMLVVISIVVRAVLVVMRPAWTHVPNIFIVILEGLAVFRFTIQQEYLGTLQLAILRIGAEFYRFTILITGLILIFAMALTVNAQGRTLPDVPAGAESVAGGGRKFSDFFPGQNNAGSGIEFGQWLLELLLLVIFGADPRAMLVLDAQEWGGWPRLLCMMVLYCTFGAFSIVVLLNVLIAMCMSAYEKVQQRREAEWQTLVFELARDYVRRPFVPPGFGWLFKTLFPHREHWSWVRFVLPGGRHLREKHRSRTELKQARAESRLSLFVDLVTSSLKEDAATPKPATQAALDSLRWQIENLQQVCCALQDQLDDESKVNKKDMNSRRALALLPPAGSALPVAGFSSVTVAPPADDAPAPLSQAGALAAAGAQGGDADAAAGAGAGLEISQDVGGQHVQCKLPAIGMA